MKILIISRYCAPPSYHGSAQHVQIFAKALVEAGHEVKVVSGEDASGVILHDGYEIEKILLPKPGKGLYRIFDGRLPNGLFKDTANNILERWQPDILHVGVFMGMGDFVIAAAAHHIPIVMMVHDYSILCLKKYFFNSQSEICTFAQHQKCFDCIKKSLGPNMLLVNGMTSFLTGVFPLINRKHVLNYNLGQAVDESFEFMNRIRQSVDKFIVQTPLATEMLVSGGIDPQRCSFVQQYIGEEKMKNYPKEYGTLGKDRPIRLGYVGRWSQEKGIDLLRDVFACQKDGTIELWVVAKDVEPSAVADFFGRERVEQGDVKLFNDLTGETLAKTIALLDLMVIPSICHDNSPRTLLEGIAQGIPAIVSNSVGNRHLIDDGVNGRIFHSGDKKSFASVVQEVINDPEIIERWRTRLPRLPDKSMWYDSLERVHRELVVGSQ